MRWKNVNRLNLKPVFLPKHLLAGSIDLGWEGSLHAWRPARRNPGRRDPHWLLDWILFPSAFSASVCLTASRCLCCANAEFQASDSHLRLCSTCYANNLSGPPFLVAVFIFSSKNLFIDLLPSQCCDSSGDSYGQRSQCCHDLRSIKNRVLNTSPQNVKCSCSYITTPFLNMLRLSTT